MKPSGHSSADHTVTRAQKPFSLERVYAIVLRYLYLLRGSWPRIVDQAYWPTVQMIMWGLVTKFFLTHSDWVAQAVGVLLAGVMLWDLLFRAQLGVSVVLMEELYARNLGHLFCSPLRPYEFVLALMGISVIRSSIGIGAASMLASQWLVEHEVLLGIWTQGKKTGRHRRPVVLLCLIELMRCYRPSRCVQQCPGLPLPVRH